MATVHEVVAAIERLAPLPYAQDWDNVSLLIEPPGTRVVGTRSEEHTSELQSR